MRILIYSRAFWPSVGGLETMMALLADCFAASGHRVIVATFTPGPIETTRSYEIVRAPSPIMLWRLAREAEVCLCASISLRGLLPLLLSARPVAISHQKWYTDFERNALMATAKNGVCYVTTNIFASDAVAAHISAKGISVPNGYDSAVFQKYRDIEKTRDLVFVGRLVSEKGGDTLIEALVLLGKEGLRPSLTIIGDGPERESLRALANQSELDAQIKFPGKLVGEGLAREVATHKIMVVPSRYEEPFGIVALEGIACGCVVVGTDGGGLPEAIGPCGLIARRGDAANLADKLRQALTDTGLASSARAAADLHLANHRPERVAGQYINVLERIAKTRTRKHIFKF